MKSKKSIPVFWYRIPGGGKNFGDELGPYIIQKLSGARITYVPVVASTLSTIKFFFEEFFSKRYNAAYLKSILQAAFTKNVVVGIGSILSFIYHPSARVWGSGIISQKVKINKAQFLAVRGKFTQQRLSELGFAAPEIIGDPALLLPLIFNKGVSKKYRLGIIPHYIHYEELAHKFNQDDVLVINLLEDVEKVLLQIFSCHKILSTSLHGIIVSQAYGIPSLWCNFNSKDNLGGDNIKFQDYFSSVAIPEYQSIHIDDLEELEELFKQNEDKTLINTDIKKLQLSLLHVAPFFVKPEFINML